MDIPGISVDILYRGRGELRIAGIDGHMGRFDHGMFTISARIDGGAPVICCMVDDKKNIVPLAVKPIKRTDDTVSQKRVSVIHNRDRTFFYTKYPDNAMRIVRLDADGRLRVWEIAIVGRSGEFFRTYQVQYDEQCYREGSRVVCARLLEWRALTGLLHDRFATIFPLLPVAPRPLPVPPEVSVEGLPPHHGRVIWFNHAKGVGAIATKKGTARVYWEDIVSDRRFICLEAGQVVRYVSLQEPVESGDRHTTFPLRATGVRVDDAPAAKGSDERLDAIRTSTPVPSPEPLPDPRMLGRITMVQDRTDASDFPVVAFKEHIMASTAPYIIVEAETGSGKTTIIPQWFFERGLKVLVTIPLIEAVIGAAEYVARLLGCRVGTNVGYHTSLQREASDQTDILFCTDGLALVRELSGRRFYDVLILDELHEWNANQSTLEAWVWKLMQGDDPPFTKVLALSATMDTAGLAAARNNAPVFSIPGRVFPITDQRRRGTIEQDVRRCVTSGDDVLVFLPGRVEIEKLERALSRLPADILPFYAELPREAKDRAYLPSDRPRVILATNALETGRTLLPSPGRQLAVIDSGMERRIELTEDGIEVLDLAPIAQSKSWQRRGRTGRVGTGSYIDHCPVPMERRPRYPVSELRRTRIDRTVLRVAAAGENAVDLPFFHALSDDAVRAAQRTLCTLGALDENCVHVTAIGEQMAELPVKPAYARMLVAARSWGVVKSILTIASILEVGGIRSMKSVAWRAFVPGEQTSELLAELDLWNMADGATAEELDAMGINPPQFWRSEATRLRLFNAFCREGIKQTETGDRSHILHACITGLAEHIYHRIPETDRYTGWGREEYFLGRETVFPEPPEWIVAIPRGQGMIRDHAGREDPRTQRKRYVTLATRVELPWLLEKAPHAVRKEGKTVYFHGTPIIEKSPTA